MNILLFHGRGIVSALIRWQTRGKYSHAALQFKNGSIVEAWQGEGVRLLSKPKHGLSGVDTFAVSGLSEQQERYAHEFAMARLGHKYDYRGVLRFVSRRKAEDNERWFCSELVFSTVAYAGVELFARTQAWEVSPSMLARSPYLVQTHKDGVKL